jgi:hypothetical protein
MGFGPFDDLGDLIARLADASFENHPASTLLPFPKANLARQPPF